MCSFRMTSVCQDLRHAVMGYSIMVARDPLSLWPVHFCTMGPGILSA